MGRSNHARMQRGCTNAPYCCSYSPHSPRIRIAAPLPECVSPLRNLAARERNANQKLSVSGRNKERLVLGRIPYRAILCELFFHKTFCDTEDLPQIDLDRPAVLLLQPCAKSYGIRYSSIALCVTVPAGILELWAHDCTVHSRDSSPEISAHREE